MSMTIKWVLHFFCQETEKKKNINPYPMQSLSYEVRMGNNEKRKSEKGKERERKNATKEKVWKAKSEKGK